MAEPAAKRARTHYGAHKTYTEEDFEKADKPKHAYLIYVMQMANLDTNAKGGATAFRNLLRQAFRMQMPMWARLQLSDMEFKMKLNTPGKQRVVLVGIVNKAWDEMELEKHSSRKAQTAQETQPAQEAQPELRKEPTVGDDAHQSKPGDGVAQNNCMLMRLAALPVPAKLHDAEKVFEIAGASSALRRPLAELSSFYRKAARSLHPDKQPHAHAGHAFAVFKGAYDLLARHLAKMI